MNQYIIEAILGLIAGVFLGITGILPVGLFLIILDYLFCKLNRMSDNLNTYLCVFI